MPGTKASQPPKRWFEDAFGFQENNEWTVRRNLSYDDGVITSQANGKSFHCGDFELVTHEKLKIKLDLREKRADDEYWKCGELTFRNISGDPRELHLDPDNAGAVFQVASLFNCLESVPPGTGPEVGISCYSLEATQGPACAIACPAGTVYRNYFVRGVGQGTSGEQVDALAELGQFLDNGRKGYWTVRNGFCMPRTAGSIHALSTELSQDAQLTNQAISKIAVGVHWHTEVAAASKHRVHQVFCSSLPVAMVQRVRVSHWASFAQVVLDSQYDATLTVGALLAAEQSQRVKVYLTLVGGGALGARREWIATAIERALLAHANAPLDVMLVHFADAERAECFKKLEVRRNEIEPMNEVQLLSPAEQTKRRQSIREEREQVLDCQISRKSLGGRNAAAVLKIFEYFDMNGDGVIDAREFMQTLQRIDKEFFTQRVVQLLVHDADADADGEIHYVAFARWLCGEAEEIYNALEAGLARHEEHAEHE